MDEIKEMKCNRCKVLLPIKKFSKNRAEKYLKSCDECRICQKKSRDKNKCEHNRDRSKCKECGGASICEHNRIRSMCKECGGASICEHNRQRRQCKECGGGSLCEHNIIRNNCKPCGGASICEHNRIRCRCKECCGASICEHNRERNSCKECGGASICEHNRQRRTCKECDLGGYIRSVVSSRIRIALKHNKNLRSIEYLGCPIDVFKKHIEEQFTEGMSWDNHGEWHIDHIIPVKYKVDGVVPTVEEICKRLHYTNTQPL